MTFQFSFPTAVLFVAVLIVTTSGESQSQTKKTDPTKKSDPAKKVTPPKAEPPKPTTKAVPEVYVILANAISNSYVNYRPNPEHYDTTQREKLAAGTPFFLQVVMATADLEQAKHPAVVAALAQIKEGMAKAKEKNDAIRKDVGIADDRLAGIYSAAERGEFKGKVERTEIVRNSDGTTRMVTKSQEVDNTMMATMFGKALNGMTRATAERNILRQTAFAMEQSRISAWNVLLPRLKNIYKNDAKLGNTLSFKIVPPDEKSGTKTRFIARNEGKTTLTNVTLILELVHFSTAPETTSLRVVFIPNLEGGSSIELAPDLIRNCLTEEYSMGRPIEAEPNIPRVREKPTIKNFQFTLGGVGGIVELKSTIYTEQGNQPERSLKFPRQAEEGGEWEIESLYRIMSMLIKDSNSKIATPKEAFARIVGNWGERVSRRIPKFLPADSESVKRAKLALENPDEFYQDCVKRADKLAAKTIVPGAMYKGDWKLIRITDDPEPTQISRGELIVRIETTNPETNSVTISVFDPANPERLLHRSGRVQTAIDGTKELYFARAIAAVDPRDRRNVPSVAQQAQQRRESTPIRPVDKASVRFISSNPIFTLVLEQSKLTGEANFLDDQFLISLKPVSDPELAKALTLATKKEQESIALAAQKKQELIVLAAQKERDFYTELTTVVYEGEWQLAFDKSISTRNSPMGMFGSNKELASPDQYRGKTTLRFEGIKAETGEFTAVFTAPMQGSVVLRRPGSITSPVTGKRIYEMKSLLTADSIKRVSERALFVNTFTKNFTLEEVDLRTATGPLMLEGDGKGLIGKLKPSYADPKMIWLDLKLERVAKP